MEGRGTHAVGHTGRLTDKPGPITEREGQIQKFHPYMYSIKCLLPWTTLDLKIQNVGTSLEIPYTVLDVHQRWM